MRLAECLLAEKQGSRFASAGIAFPRAPATNRSNLSPSVRTDTPEEVRYQEKECTVGNGSCAVEVVNP